MPDSGTRLLGQWSRCSTVCLRLAPVGPESSSGDPNRVRVSFGSLRASSANLRCRVEMTSRPNVPAICPPASSIIRSAASLRRVLWGEFPDLVGSISRLRLLVPRRASLRCLRSALPPLRPPSLPRSRATPRGPGPLLSRRPRRLITMEKTRYPRFLDDPCLHAPLFDPGGPLTPGHYGAAMRPSAVKTASAPQQWIFRGSITRPTHSLCTLRSQDRSWTTQHSVPAGGQPWPVRIRTCWVAKKVSVMSVPLHGFVG